jgi:phage terminase large subunit GpA-like protein
MNSADDSTSLPLPAELRSARQLISRAIARGIKPEPLLTVSEWADQYRVLTASASAEAGPWRTARTPYLREIMDCLSPSHPVQIVVFQKGTQIGGSECGYNFIGYIVDRAPGPVMLVMPTSNTAKRISKTRIAPMIEGTPALREKIREAKSRDSGNTTLLKEFDGGQLTLAGANSAAELKSAPVRYLVEDEIDEYPLDVDGQGDPEELAEKRTDTFARKKIYKASTPTVKASSRIDRAYAKSDQRRYFVPCPHCGHMQWLRWDQIRYETRKVREAHDPASGEIREIAQGEASDLPVVERDTGELVDVHYECEACQESIAEHHKTKMLELGRWIAQRAGPDRSAGFHLSALYSPLGWFSWRQAVLKYLAAIADVSGELLKVFTNTILAESYEEAGETFDEHELKKRVENYRVGQVPDGALLLFWGVDVQHDRLEGRLWGYGEGEEAWLVDRQIVYGNVAQDETWTELAELLDKVYARSSGTTMRARGMAIDAGDGNTTHYVRAFARKYAHRGAMAVKGQAASGKPVIGRPTEQDVSWRGKTIKKGVKLWPVGSDTAKAVLYNRFKLEAPGPGYVHLPGGLPDEEFEQLTAERLVTRYVRGYAKREWLKDAGRRNEALDCWVYAYACAMRFGVARTNWARLRAILDADQKDLFAAPATATEQPAEGEAAALEQLPPPAPTPAAPRQAKRPPRRARVSFSATRW